MNHVCDKCLTRASNLILNTYGVLLCEECWDEYINTPAGKVEYLIGIAKAEYPASEFSADFICYTVIQWYKNRSQLDMSDKEIEEIENKLKRIRLF